MQKRKQVKLDCITEKTQPVCVVLGRLDDIENIQKENDIMSFRMTYTHIERNNVT